MFLLSSEVAPQVLQLEELWFSPQLLHVCTVFGVLTRPEQTVVMSVTSEGLWTSAEAEWRPEPR